ncbi:hypothetical protein B0T25DRAFT_450151 [Lasiosphaeria hispida]|uniref:DUF8021 domain-containing protein n=1 Tax=Lasiosphaeria hispida TaxID=260671 RepID=A0AAJ0HKE9_9PEZI|nr:hypothetical protein B0T25DRAFT_450151 [Lasiosphaeria hispida]
MLYSTSLSLLALASTAHAACSRGFLQEATTAYLQAQSAGKISILSLASNVSYAENNTPIDIQKGVISEAITIDFNRSIYDTVQCATFTELTATSSHPYVIHTRILYAEEKIRTIESVVTDTGDWAFNATGHLYWTKQETWDQIPEGKRDSRTVIQAAGDAYLDQWGAPSLPVPLGTPCARLEGGFYTAREDSISLQANTCKMGAFPQPLKVGDRRYIIDEELGAVDIFNGFPWLEQSKPANYSTPSSNFFKVGDGLIRYIHEITVCATPRCGL